MIKVKFSKLHPDAVIPSYAKYGDNGLDLTAISHEFVKKENLSYHNYEFGLAIEIPFGYVGLIFPRSSISNKKLMLTNSVGVIDSSYRGTLSARFKVVDNSDEKSHNEDVYKTGDRVAQLVILPCPQVEIQEVSFELLSKTERGLGGFGSTGC